MPNLLSISHSIVVRTGLEPVREHLLTSTWPYNNKNFSLVLIVALPPPKSTNTGREPRNFNFSRWVYSNPNSQNNPLLRIGRTSSHLLSSRFILRRRTASEVSEPQLCRLLVVRIGIEPILCRRYPTFVNLRPNATITSSDYIGHGFGFPICVHTFSSCVILREITRCPPKNPYFLSHKNL